VISITLPKKIEKRLKEESERAGVSEEELVLEALSKFLNEPLDPETKVETHLKLSEKYMRDAEDFLSRKDYVQAFERAWAVLVFIIVRFAYLFWLSALRAIRYADAVCLSKPYLLISSECSAEFVVPLGSASSTLNPCFSDITIAC